MDAERHQRKQEKIQAQERFARKVPYRLTWLTDPNPDMLQPWEVLKIHGSLRERLPLQAMLVPVRSIPVRGLGAPDFAVLPSPCPPLPSNLWELKLLSRRFPRQGAHVLPLQRVAPHQPPRGQLAESSRDRS
ncbi:uncharacterized protein C3orf22 homolog [Dasypus novemcinctus]|uniref:uncharacterized protein C3orf22 homolog n=1 Tax=Dasypus novemcinctus TaxID=9361 RepID=UPI000328828D|nr:uncharacterized protein C3orf22 homolog [Dasypus novemcinctus]